MSSPRSLSVDLGQYELTRDSDGRFRDRATEREAWFVRGFGWGLRIGSNPHCWWLSEHPGGARGRLSLGEKVLATLEAPDGPQGEHVTLTLAKELDGPFQVILAGVSPELAMAIADGWSRPRGEKEGRP